MKKPGRKTWPRITQQESHRARIWTSQFVFLTTTSLCILEVVNIFVNCVYIAPRTLKIKRKKMFLEPHHLSRYFIYLSPHSTQIAVFAHARLFIWSLTECYTCVCCLSKKEFKGGDSRNYKIRKAFWLQVQMYMRKGSSSSLKHLTLWHRESPEVEMASIQNQPVWFYSKANTWPLAKPPPPPHKSMSENFPCRGSLHSSRDRARKGRESFFFLLKHLFAYC